MSADDGADTIVKEREDAPAGFFEAEAAGLRWLGESAPVGGVPTARVVDVRPGRISLERVSVTAPDPLSARAFGEALAITHDSGAPAFGAAPPGQSALFIGRRPQPVAAEQRWGVFYARDRVLPFLPAALAAGFLTESEAEIVRDACGVIAGGAFDDPEPPARIHGDLWHGNVLWSREGVVLIDPAAHGGHRETDLAMLDLFGAPFLDDIVAGYQRRHALRPGWRERSIVHQLHPLAVHAAGHGRPYGLALRDAARRVLALR